MLFSRTLIIPVNKPVCHDQMLSSLYSYVVSAGVVYWIPLLFPGVEGVVRRLEGIHLADRCILTKLEQCHLFLPSPLHACPSHGSWATFIRLSHARAKSEILVL
jgi:hypothetical protein